MWAVGFFSSPSWRENTPKYFLFPPLYCSYLRLIFLLNEFTLLWNLFSFLYKNLQFADNITLIPATINGFSVNYVQTRHWPNRSRNDIAYPSASPWNSVSWQNSDLKKIHKWGHIFVQCTKIVKYIYRNAVARSHNHSTETQQWVPFVLSYICRSQPYTTLKLLPRKRQRVLFTVLELFTSMSTI